MDDNQRVGGNDGVMELRRYRREDDHRIWALNDIPNIGHTADPDAPLPLPDKDQPPAAFPAMADITSTFLDPGGEFLVGEHDGHLVAMGGIRPSGEDRAEVMFIRVHPATRRRGFGRALMNALEDAARQRGFAELHLDTATNQPEAVEFYRGLGYVEAGTETRPDWNWTLVYFIKALSPPGGLVAD